MSTSPASGPSTSESLVLRVFRAGQMPVLESFDQEVVKVGKLESSHLRLAAADVSRMHAVIELCPEAVYVIDLGSKAGTIVNDRKVNKRALVVGDLVAFGNDCVEVMQLPARIPPAVPVAAAPAKRVPKPGELWQTSEGAMVQIQGDMGAMVIGGEIKRRLEAHTWPGRKLVFVDAESLTFVSTAEETAAAIPMLHPVVEMLEETGRALGGWAQDKDAAKVAVRLLEVFPKAIVDAIEELVLRRVLSEGAAAEVFGDEPPVAAGPYREPAAPPPRVPKPGEVWGNDGLEVTIGNETRAARSSSGASEYLLYRAFTPDGAVWMDPAAFEFLRGPEEHADGEIELRITDQAFEPNYGGWNIQFQAIGAPRLAHQSSDPSLEAFVKLEVVDTAHRLASGGGSALARSSDGDVARGALSMLTGTAEGNILATGFGAVSVDTGTPMDVPVALPSDERLLEAMQRSLAVHMDKVREERARLKVTETAAAYVGKSFKVRA